MSTPAADGTVLVPARWVDIPTSDAIPRRVTYTVPEAAVWLGFMEYGEEPGSQLYRAATQRVRRMVQRGELPVRNLGGKSYLIPGEGLRDYLQQADEPITAKEAS